jgi:hypothetical protein
MSFTVNGTTGITFPNNTTQNTAASGYAFHNRLINGDMRIDQRNAGASVNNTGAAGQFSVDRWRINGDSASKFSAQQNAGSVTPPVGFANYLGITSLSAYSVPSGEDYDIIQAIEGFNTFDLDWGTANAKTVTLSFWVRSSLTGTFGGALQNSAFNRSYPFTYTISAANTWEQKSVTIAGDTTGTWIGATNGIGLRLYFGLGVGTTRSGTAGAWAGSDFRSATGATSVVGTSGATFYITGVQLEKDSVATSFDVRPYGTELALCQRYFEKSYDIATVPNTVTTLGQFNSGGVQGATTASEINGGSPIFAVQKRATPTVVVYDTNGNSGKVNRVQYGVTNNFNSTGSASDIGQTTFTVISGSGATASGLIYQWTASAEL